MQRHGAVYAEEFGWNQDFEAFAAKLAADYLDIRHDQRAAAWIAEVDGAPAAAVCLPEDATTARLRMLLVERWARGLGIGTQLVERGAAVRPPGRLPAHRAVHLRRARQRPADLPGGRLHAGLRGASAQFRTGTERPGLGAIFDLLAQSCAFLGTLSPRSRNPRTGTSRGRLVLRGASALYYCPFIVTGSGEHVFRKPIGSGCRRGPVAAR